MNADGGTTLARNCVADGCRTNVRPDLVMCRKHWGLVPTHLRGLIRQAIGADQAEATDKTRHVVRALLTSAIAAVAKAEGRLPFAL